MFRRSWFCKIRVKRRYIVALLAFFGFCNIYMLRFTSWQHSVYFHKNRCTCICVMSVRETLLAGWECVCPFLSIQKQDLLNPFLQFFVIVYAFFQGKLECGGGGDDNKPDSPPSQWNHYRGKQIQTNANTNTKSTMTNTSTNKTHHPSKGTTTEARKHKTKHKQCLFSSTHFRENCQQIFFKNVKASSMFHISWEIFAFL